MLDKFFNQLFDWFFVLLYRILQGLLNLVHVVESMFDIFAGTSQIRYNGRPEFLINVFFGHDAVTNVFWAMALIAVVMAFAFAIFQVARKATDVSGTMKQSVGQIMSGFFRCLLIVIMLNALTVAAIKMTNTLLDRINFAMENAQILDQAGENKTFTDEDFGNMARIYAKLGNYVVNEDADNHYNVNSCFNDIRADLLELDMQGFFNYDYPKDRNDHLTWQGGLALLATSADLRTDLMLTENYPDVNKALKIVWSEMKNYPDFAPAKEVSHRAEETMNTDVMIFLTSTMNAANNKMYNNGDLMDSLRRGYISGEKNYNNMEQVRQDFDIWKIDYLVGTIASVVMVIILAICIFTFIVRMFNLVLLYLTAPLFASTMPADEGSKWQNWVQAFVIQLFSGFGMVIAMRLYLIVVPIVCSSSLVFFDGSNFGARTLNYMAQLFMILGGAWAVLQAGNVITGILAGNPGMAAIQQEGRIAGKVTQTARQTPGMAVKAAKLPMTAISWAVKAPSAAISAAKGIHQFAKNAAGVGHDFKQSIQRSSAYSAFRKGGEKQDSTSEQLRSISSEIKKSAGGKNILSSSAQGKTVPNKPLPSVPARASGSSEMKKSAEGKNILSSSAQGKTVPNKPLPSVPSRASGSSEMKKSAGGGNILSSSAQGKTVPNKPIPSAPVRDSGSSGVKSSTGGRNILSSSAQGKTVPNKPIPSAPVRDSGSSEMKRSAGGENILSSSAQGKTVPNKPLPSAPVRDSGSSGVKRSAGGENILSSSAQGKTVPNKPLPPIPPRQNRSTSSGSADTDTTPSGNASGTSSRPTEKRGDRGRH